MEDKLKTSKLILGGLAAISLSACGATTGGVAKSMAKQAAVQTARTAVMPETQTPVTASQSHMATLDPQANCASLSAELTAVNADIIAANQTLETAGGSDFASRSAVAGLSQAAVRGGASRALSKVPFGRMFAKSAIDSVADSARMEAEKAEADLQNANLRKANLTGLYAGKGCGT